MTLPFGDQERISVSGLNQNITRIQCRTAEWHTES
jgi:hypothetical protein